MDSEPATKSTNRDLAKLDEHEKMMIRRSWNELMRDVEKSALEIFQMIFERAPEAKELFPFMQSSPKKRTEALKFHSLRFMQIDDNLILTYASVDALLRASIGFALFLNKLRLIQKQVHPERRTLHVCE
ncbi:unnamed protein product [Gongylonema pulchrum]|uniref:GLOBIN domain-containing protein n=1 Tax=Gongylonema pulchrum TaxID=637853 RepID=A0A183EEI5_9BILA|nr:unnamed protein product [Gongylonema pulchrum]